MTRAFGRRALAFCAAGIFVLAGPLAAQTGGATVTAVPGKSNVVLSTYDLGELGYRVDESFVAGTAASYRLTGPATTDGMWNARPAATAPFKTRVVVARPTDPAKFNGTVLVEWMNVTGGLDVGASWTVAHREILRKGYAWVGVSAQAVTIEGGRGVMGPAPALKKTNAARYGTLSHPGDAFSFDIFSQVGAALKRPGASGLLGPLVPRRLIASGESQSATFLTTYINAVDPLARIYDGFFVHSRFGMAAPLDGSGMGIRPEDPAFVRFRPDLRVPVLALITETDLIDGRRPGYNHARRPDDRRLRVWEVPGAAHADNYMFGGGNRDNGRQPIAELAKVFVPTRQGPLSLEAVPLNPGMPHHYVGQAAVAALDRWVRTGRPPAIAPRIAMAPNVRDDPRRDAQGIALGGIRTPWTDVPAIRLSGKGDPKSFVGSLAGSGLQLTKAELAALYPGGKAEYLRRFTAALDAAIRAGHILREDRREILEIAAINYDAAP
ncbi:MAG: alpha/beta hydrolase domain-containing protein [Novosphingobium sp.]